MEPIDVENLASQAVQRARVLTHQANLAAQAAVTQAVALLNNAGLSQREIARLTGLSKSDVARKVQQRQSLGVTQAKGADGRVYDFADEWIWGSAESAQRVDAELQRGAVRRPVVAPPVDYTPPAACAGGACGGCLQCRSQ